VRLLADAEPNLEAPAGQSRMTCSIVVDGWRWSGRRSAGADARAALPALRCRGWQALGWCRSAMVKISLDGATAQEAQALRAYISFLKFLLGDWGKS